MRETPKDNILLKTQEIKKKYKKIRKWKKRIRDGRSKTTFIL